MSQNPNNELIARLGEQLFRPHGLETGLDELVDTYFSGAEYILINRRLRRTLKSKGISFLELVVERFKEFTTGEYSNFMDTCGLYLTGSALTSQIPNDADLVLVGLDFRAAIKYDKIFLQDKDELIKQGMVCEPKVFKVLEGDVDDPSMIVSFTDLNPTHIFDAIEQAHRVAFEKDGVTYEYDKEAHYFFGGYSDFEDQCKSHGHRSELVKALYAHIFKDVTPNPEWHIGEAFEPYCYHSDRFLVIKYQWDYVRKSFLEASRNLQLTPNQRQELKAIAKWFEKEVDFIVHAENMTVSSWKVYQEQQRLPYSTIWEGSKVNSTETRPVITTLEYPDFIDPEGKSRVKNVGYARHISDPEQTITVENYEVSSDNK